jgi:hypothetical protein
MDGQRNEAEEPQTRKMKTRQEPCTTHEICNNNLTYATECNPAQRIFDFFGSGMGLTWLGGMRQLAGSSLQHRGECCTIVREERIYKGR